MAPPRTDCPRPAWRRAHRRHVWGPCHCGAAGGAAPSIRVASTIVAAANSEAVLAIEVGPLDAGPHDSFVSLRGLPPDRGAAGTGMRWGRDGGPSRSRRCRSWRREIPEGGSVGDRVSLIAMDGRLLAQARSTLVVQARLSDAHPRPIATAQGAAPTPPLRC